MWRYYNNALVPDCPPNVTADVNEALSSDIWKSKKTLFLRYTSDYGSDKYTEWYYCVKDDPLDIDSLKAKRRYEINKGKKNFEVKEIIPEEHKENMFRIYQSSIASYKTFSSNAMTREQYYEYVKTIPERHKTFGAFDIESGVMVGFILFIEYPTYVDFNGCKADPSYENKGCNAALVNHLCEYYRERLSKGGFMICDGQRSILHETNFQDYLEKYFGFHKAYCKLNIVYKNYFYFAVKCLWPFRKIIDRLSSNRLFGKINGVLKFEEVKRIQDKCL